jgi:hypothetical protein
LLEQWMGGCGCGGCGGGYCGGVWSLYVRSGMARLARLAAPSHHPAHHRGV